MIKVISGGQTGADQGGIIAARRLGIETGGWAPLGWLTEKGPAPWLADYGLCECELSGYPARRKRNVRDSEVTLWFGNVNSYGGIGTRKDCEAWEKPFVVVSSGMTPKQIAQRIVDLGPSIINIAGNRESSLPGIQERVIRFCTALFSHLASESHLPS